MRVMLAPIGGFIGAVFGGILWAKYIQLTGNTAGFIAIAIGVLTGIGMLLTGSRAIDPDDQRHWIILSIGAAVFALVGIAIGKYLDVRWNAITLIAEQLVINEPLLSEEAATSMAETQYSGASKWELMRPRMDVFDIFFSAVAVFAASFITSNKRVRKYFTKTD